MTPTSAASSAVVVASSPFWASETFWAAAAVAVAVGAGIVGAYATLRAAFPKRRMVYSFTSSALVQRHQRNVSSNVLHIYLGTRELADPRLVSLRLENPGRRDISSVQFDQGTPMRVTLGLPIVELVSMAAEPPGNPGLNDVALEGNSAVSIRPGLLKAGAAITYTFLVDGEPSQYSLSASLVEVDLTQKFPPKTQ